MSAPGVTGSSIQSCIFKVCATSNAKAHATGEKSTEKAEDKMLSKLEEIFGK